jgi:hypothetical protein
MNYRNRNILRVLQLHGSACFVYLIIITCLPECLWRAGRAPHPDLSGAGPLGRITAWRNIISAKKEKIMRLILLTMFLTFVVTGSVSGQSAISSDSLEQKIRKLEQAQVDALLRNDISAMKTNWATDYVVNNPMNEVIEAGKGRIQSGTRTYSSFIRAIERVLIHENTVIVMGQETVVPSGNAPDAGKIIIRRFTNFWMMRDGRWLLTARQATVICP